MTGLLGGKNGKLKCECGNLRYKGVKLCPNCYFSKVRYYLFHGLYRNESGYDGCNIFDSIKLFVVKAINDYEAVEKIDNINKFNVYGRYNSYNSNGYIIKSNVKTNDFNREVKTLIGNIYISGLLIPFKTKDDLRNYIKKHNLIENST